MDEFSKQLHSVTESISGAAKGFMSYLDHLTFKMLIDNLKANDLQVVIDTISQLEKEKRPLSIAPLYFVSKNHPNPKVREQAQKAVLSMVDPAELEKLTAGKTSEEATKILIQEFGHYRNN